MGNRVTHILSLACLCWWLPTAALAEVRVDVQTSTRELTIDQQLTVRITIQSEGAGSPEIELPDFVGFEVVQQQVQRPMQFSFNMGQKAVFRSSSIYTYVLSPLQIGKLRIPSVKVRSDGELYTTQPIDITVKGDPGGGPQPGQPNQPQPPGTQEPQEDGQASPPAAQPGAPNQGVEFDPQAFVRTVVDQPRPYVGQQVTVTIYLYTRERLQSAPSIDQEATADGFWTRDLLPPGHQLQPRRQVVNGSAFTVYVLRRFAAFPLRAGEATIGPMSLTIDNSSVFDMFTGGRRRPNLQRTGVPVLLEVQELPEQGRPAGAVAVGQYSIEAKFDRAQTATGDAVTLTAMVRGRGNIETVALETPQVAGLDILQPQTKDLVETPNDLVTGTREYRWLVVPREPGHFTVPELALETFDPATKRYRRVASNPLTLEAVGAALANAPTAPEPTESPSERRAAEAAESIEWAPIHTQSALSRGNELIANAPWYGWGLALPPLLWLLIGGIGLARRRIGARTLSAAQQAAREARQQLEGAEQAARKGDASEFHAATARAIMAQLEAALGESVASLTHDQLRQHLRDAAMGDDLVKSVVQQLQQADFARFASASQGGGELSAQLGELRRVLEQLQRFGSARTGESLS